MRPINPAYELTNSKRVCYDFLERKTQMGMVLPPVYLKEDQKEARLL